MEHFVMLILLCISMMLGSFISGTIPMFFKLSESKSRLLALLGSGILVGTALAVIIPEGIESIVQNQSQFLQQTHSFSSSSSSTSEQPVSHSQHGVKNDAFEKTPNLKQPTFHIGQSTDNEPPISETSIGAAAIGLSLISGFVIMLLFDQFLLYRNKFQSAAPLPHHHSNQLTAKNNKSEYLYRLASQQEDNLSADAIEIDTNSKLNDEVDGMYRMPIVDSSSVNVNSLHNRSSSFQSSSDFLNQAIEKQSSVTTSKVTPTLGLVVHSAIEGIAMGAAATSPRPQVEIIVFSAITLHKAPAAFSLVVFLLHMKTLSRSEIRRHLLAFSLSSPLSALLTYLGLSQSGKEALRQNSLTGIAMLFSAGTFLYVATVHVLPELVYNKPLTGKELICLVGGSFLPLILANTI